LSLRRRPSPPGRNGSSDRLDSVDESGRVLELRRMIVRNPAVLAEHQPMLGQRETEALLGRLSPTLSERGFFLSQEALNRRFLQRTDRDPSRYDIHRRTCS
jgi:hypothetical protein